jgi:hypothetical protein
MNGDGFRFRTGIGHTHSSFQSNLLACDSGTPSYLPHNNRSGYALSITWESCRKRQQLPPAIDPSLWKPSVVRLNHLPTNRSCRSGFLRNMGFLKNTVHARVGRLHATACRSWQCCRHQGSSIIRASLLLRLVSWTCQILRPHMP